MTDEEEGTTRLTRSLSARFQRKAQAARGEAVPDMPEEELLATANDQVEEPDEEAALREPPPPSTRAERFLELARRRAAAGGAAGGAAGAGAGADVEHLLSAEEAAAVARLMALGGFSRAAAAEAFLACERDEALAANLLFDSQP